MRFARAMRFSGLLVVFLTSASAIPLQMRGDTSGLNEAVYTEPELMEALARSYGALGGGAHEGRDYRITRQSRQGLDSLSGATFGESKRFDPRRKPELSHLSPMELYNGAIKRNIDEIDRAGFDSFSKRNFDEIDRAGWDSFVKRRFVDAYLASRQH
ncbi:orcokinin peptides-like [Diachasmimorpha longicaudata]|uniref:orcokinin peptides-like n=1 Tax=Diachasmimorpha longicaudata TaxID=58733 RepID=UPI0030B8FDD3